MLSEETAITRTLAELLFTNRWYTKSQSMRRLGSWRLFVALLLVLSASAPSLDLTISWFCDGRLCGTLSCCCEQLDTKKNDKNCRKVTTDTKAPSLCQAGCGCTPVWTSASDHQGSLATAAPFPSVLFVLVPTPLLLEAVPFVNVRFVRIPDYRGPPALQHDLLPSGLRAPPAS